MSISSIIKILTIGYGMKFLIERHMYHIIVLIHVFHICVGTFSFEKEFYFCIALCSHNIK